MSGLVSEESAYWCIAISLTLKVKGTFLFRTRIQVY